MESVNKKLNIDLTKDEIDYMLLEMFKKECAMDKLQMKVLIEHINELSLKLIPKKQEEEIKEKPVIEPKKKTHEKAKEKLPEKPKEKSPEKPKEESPVKSLEGSSEKSKESGSSEKKRKPKEVKSEKKKEKPAQKLEEPMEEPIEEPIQPAEEIKPKEDEKANEPLPEPPSKEKAKKGKNKPVKEEKGGEEEEMEMVSEEDVIKLAQRCFHAIAMKMVETNQNVDTLFEGVIFKKAIEGEEAELITAEEFIKGIQKLGIEGMQELDYQCLIKALAVSDDEQLIRVNDLVQILEDYGNAENMGSEGGEDLPFDELDNISLVLMLALTEYLIREKVPLYDLFGEAVFKQEIQVDNKQIQLDLIESKDFFAVMNGIGVNTDEKEHENLKAFLCLDPSYPDKLLLEKIKRAIQEFAENEGLRAKAQQCYQELVEGDEAEEPGYFSIN